MKKLLVHTCCAPCATVPVDRLKAIYDLTLFYGNPNIEPEEEWKKRLHDLKRFAEQYDVELIPEAYNNSDWQTDIAGLEQEPEGGKRCRSCFEHRLRMTAELAASGFDCFTTTLTVSPHKNTKTIFEIATRVAAEYETVFLETDFKKNNGFQQSVAMSREYNMYRQNYCGCLYSKP